MTLKLLAEHHLEFLSFKGGFSGSSESLHIKMPHCWKSHVTAHIYLKIRSKDKLSESNEKSVFLWTGDCLLLLDFSLTVKAATLIFISGLVRLFHLLRKGNQVLSIIW